MNLKSQLNGLLKLFERGLRCSSRSVNPGCRSAVFLRSGCWRPREQLVADRYARTRARSRNSRERGLKCLNHGTPAPVQHVSLGGERTKITRAVCGGDVAVSGTGRPAGTGAARGVTAHAAGLWLSSPCAESQACCGSRACGHRRLRVNALLRSFHPRKYLSRRVVAQLLLDASRTRVWQCWCRSPVPCADGTAALSLVMPQPCPLSPAMPQPCPQLYRGPVPVVPQPCPMSWWCRSPVPSRAAALVGAEGDRAVPIWPGRWDSSWSLQDSMSHM